MTVGGRPIAEGPGFMPGLDPEGIAASPMVGCVHGIDMARRKGALLVDHKGRRYNNMAA